MPYRWGKFQGWSLVLGTPLLAVISIAQASTQEQYDAGIGAALACLLSIPMGIGIIKKKRYGLILVYVTLGLICLGIIVGFVRSGPAGALAGASGSGVWIASTIYYHKRRDEFT